MAVVRAFRALRPVTDKAEAVAALPYDVRKRRRSETEIRIRFFMLTAQRWIFRRKQIFMTALSMTEQGKILTTWKKMAQ